MKKVIRSVAVVAMLCSLMAFSACNTFNLIAYKAEIEKEIENCVSSFAYSEDNREVVCKVVEDGKKALAAAKSKTDVDATKTKVIQGIAKVNMEEWGKIVDDTVYEFRKEKATAEFSYAFIKNIKSENGFWTEELPVFRLFSCADNVARWGYKESWENNFYSFENEIFYKYAGSRNLETFGAEYTKIELGLVKQGKTLYEHIVENAENEQESFFHALLNVLIDTKDKFDIQIQTDGVFKFTTQIDEDFSIWDIYRLSRSEDGQNYAVTKFDFEAKIENGKIRQLSFLGNSDNAKVDMGMTFVYENIEINLPQI